MKKASHAPKVQAMKARVEVKPLSELPLSKRVIKPGRKSIDPITDAAIQHIRLRSMQAEIAEKLGITRQAVSLWRKVPAEQVQKVASIIRWSPKRIRPDLYERA